MEIYILQQCVNSQHVEGVDQNSGLLIHMIRLMSKTFLSLCYTTLKKGPSTQKISAGSFRENGPGSKRRIPLILVCLHKNLQECTYCPAYVFLSKTEQTRHFKLFHRRKYRGKTSASTEGSYVCNINVDGNNLCGEHCSSTYQLHKHKQNLSHCKKHKTKTPYPTQGGIWAGPLRARLGPG